MSDESRAWDRLKGSDGPKGTSTQLQAAQDRWRHAEEENQRLRAQVEEILSQQDDLLRQSGSQQAYFQAVLGQLPAGVVVAEVPSGRVLFRNRQVELIFRQQLADVGNVLQPHGVAGFHRDGRQYRWEEWPLVRAIRQGEIVKDEHVGMVRGDGSCAMVSISASPIRNTEGQITAVVAVDHDVTDLYMAREQIRQIHEDLLGIFERIQDVVVAIDREQRLTYINRYMAKLAGVNPEEVIGLNVWERFPEFLGTEVEVNCRRAVAEQVPVRFEMRGVFMGRHYDVIAFPTQEGLTFHGRDITDRKRAEEALKESETRLRLAVESTQLGTYDWYVRTNRLEWSDLAKQHFGLSPNAHIDYDVFLEGLHPEDRLRVEHMIQEARAAGHDTDFAIEFRTIGIEDRQLRWLASRGRVLFDPQGLAVRFTGTTLDITQRKQAEAEREHLLAEQARQREFLQGLIDSSPIGIAVCQGPEFQILLTNPAYREFWPDRLLLGRTLAEALPEVVANFTPEQLQAVLRTGQPDHFREYPMPNLGEREQTWWNVDRIPLRNEQGQYDLVLVMIQDVTDYVLARRQVEQTAAHLEELNETLERRVAERAAVAEQRAAQLQKLAGELTRVEERERRRLAEVLHDHLQQLLVGAKFGMSMARTKIGDPAAREALRQVDELLDESIEASRSLTTELSPPIVYQADLAGVLQWLARWMQEKHGLEVEVRVEPAIDPQAEETRIVLFHAVRELLLNVAKYARVNRAIVRLEGSENYVRISVEDEGVGFDPGQMDLQRQASGGFGLFSIQERLIMLGGRMEIQSAPRAGTKVTLWAPLQRGPLLEQGGAPAVPAPFVEGEDLEVAPAGRTAVLRVMLADDHEVVRNGLARLLQTQSGIEVVAQASDGQMAVDLARQVRPDVIVMDVSMPRLDGVEATRRIKRELPHVRVVGLSMHAEADMAERMVQAGATAYLAKSSAPDELVTAIQMAGRSND